MKTDKIAIITITEDDTTEELKISIEFKPPIPPGQSSARGYYVNKFIQFLNEEDDFVVDGDL